MVGLQLTLFGLLAELVVHARNRDRPSAGRDDRAGTAADRARLRAPACRPWCCGRRSRSPSLGGAGAPGFVGRDLPRDADAQLPRPRLVPARRRPRRAARPGPWEDQRYVYAPVTMLLLHGWSMLWGTDGSGQVATTDQAYAVRHLGVGAALARRAGRGRRRWPGCCCAAGRGGWWPPRCSSPCRPGPGTRCSTSRTCRSPPATRWSPWGCAVVVMATGAARRPSRRAGHALVAGLVLAVGHPSGHLARARAGRRGSASCVAAARRRGPGVALRRGRAGRRRRARGAIYPAAFAHPGRPPCSTVL